MQSIPNVKFESKNEKVEGIEVISLDRISDTKNLPDAVDPEIPHRLDFYMLILFTKGSSTQLIDFERYDVGEYSLVYLSKGQVTAHSFNEDLEGYGLIFTEEYFESHFSQLAPELILNLFTSKLFSPVISIPESHNLLKYFELMMYEIANPNNKVQSTVIGSLFTIILSLAQEVKSKQIFLDRDVSKVQLVSRFIHLVKSNYTTSRNANHFATELGITYKHLNLTCKDILNLTAKQYIDDYIILEAKRKLINSSIKSTELAFELGFEEPTNFTKFFKKRTELTPNSFKKLYSK